MVVAAFLAGGLAGRVLGAEVPVYTFAVVPQGPPEKMRALWLPLLARLSAATGIPLELQVHAKVEDFQADLAAGKIDLAHANPVQAIHAHRAEGYRPFVRDDTILRGIFFVAADSPYRTVDSLAGQEVAFVAPWTFCSQSLMAYTRGLGIAPKFVGTAANAYKNVLLGLTPAGGLLDTSLAEAPAEVRAKLRIIYETPPLPPHAVVAHPRVPGEVTARLAAAIVDLARKDGAGLFAAVHLQIPVEAVYARDYAPLEHLLGDDTAAVPARRRAP
jgi:phosphonate transport system substrate-binding protein